MRVLINTLAHVGGGGITYLQNMIPRFADDDNEYVILVPDSRGMLSEPTSSNIQFKYVNSFFDPLPTRLLYEQIILPIRLRQWDIDVLFSPADLTPLVTNRSTLLAVRNPNPYFSASEFGLERPFTRRVKFFIQRQLTKLSAKKAEHVFFVSDFSREISNKYLSLPDSKTSTLYHGMDASLFIDPAEPTDPELKETLDAKAPYVLTVSTVAEHKNYEVLLRAYGRLPPETRDTYPLIIAGRTPSESYLQTLKGILHKQGIEDDVIFLGGVDYENVPYLYSNATLYVLPSKLETFGHTLVEAMTSGVPVVAADSTCMPEITDGAAALFDPDDDERLASIIEELLNNEDERKSLRKRGRRRAKDFSWDKTFEQTKRLLERIGPN
jgi:glycosyltransferase involved in cell wall biosynthesis